MKTYPSNNKAERVGMWLGRAWRALMRREGRLAHWLVSQGVPISAANASIWIIRLALLAAVLWFSTVLAVLIAVLLVIVLFASRGMAQADQSETKWFPKPDDHRNELFYDPINYNDDPDPRFEDDDR